MSRPDEKTERSSQTGMRGLLDFEMSEVKRKRKWRTLTMCEVCNIQLNSSTQAQIHYNGKTHQRRLRQANRAKTGAGARKITAHTMQFRLDCGSLEPTSPYNKTMKRSPVQGGALLKSLPVQDLKRFLPLRANISSPLNLFSNFGLMDPVQKAVISHTFSIAQSLKKKQIITCNICHLRFNSTIQAEAHYKGHKHAQKLKAIDKLKSKQWILEKSVCRERGRKKPEDESVSERTEPSQASKPEDVGTDGISITSSSKKLCESKRLSESPAPILPLDPRLTCDLEPVVKGNGSWRNCSRSLQCPICKVTVNSGSQLEDHYKGFKHRLMLRRGCTLPLKKWARKVDASGAMPRPKHLSLNAAPSDQSHHCNVCDVDVNSEAQLQQHISSRRHRGRATGKSQKIKFNNSVFTTKLTLQKELSKTLTSSLPTSALTPASLFAMPTGPFCLSHAHPLPAIIHTPLFNPTLFRPALGPLRPTHGPIVFSPY